MPTASRTPTGPYTLNPSAPCTSLLLYHQPPTRPGYLTSSSSSLMLLPYSLPWPHPSPQLLSPYMRPAALGHLQHANILSQQHQDTPSAQFLAVIHLMDAYAAN